MPPTTSAPDSPRRSERSRRAILDAALDMVCEEGYGKLCIEGIAARAGVGKQTIYRWWPSKGAVLLDALFAPGDGDARALPDTGDLEADLRAGLRATVAELTDARHDEPLRALDTAITHDPALAEAYAERLARPVADARRERLRRAQEAGQLAPDLDLDLAAEMLWGPLHRRWLQRTGPLTPAYADEVVRTALHGLRPRPG